jgi:RimJ/RimL family protein N-acetyltransferase/catechol 2,3-dioxygenase-like lactoylglutathione lyase family enzyme
MDGESLVTERLMLRPLAPEHAAALHAIYADPEVMRFWHTPPHQGGTETERLVASLLAEPPRAFVLIDHRSPRPFGLIYFLGVGPTTGLGYILARSHWHRGLMSEAVRAMIDFGFKHGAIERIELWIAAGNVASRRVADRTGFQPLGTFLQKAADRDQPAETMVYGLRREQWPGVAPVGTTTVVYAVSPTLRVADVWTTAQYYRDCLGFRIGFTAGDPPVYAILQFGEWHGLGARVHLEKAAPPPSLAGLTLRFEIGPGIDELFGDYARHGVEIVESPTTRPWGARDFAVRDCNGCLLRFTTPA